MSTAETLITEHIDTWSSAIKAKSSAGRGSSKKHDFYGIKKLRELILELAVRGLLVQQDASESSAVELLKHSRHERARAMRCGTIKNEKQAAVVAEDEQPFKLPSGWAWCRVVDSGDYINGLAFSARDWSSTGRPIIRIQNLSGRNTEFNHTLSEVDDSVVVNEGDILVSWSATLDAYIWRGEQGVLNQHIFRVEPSKIFVRSYLYWLLKWVIRVLASSEHSHGLVMAHINRGPFLAQPIGLPPLGEQHRIVAKVDELMALCDQLEQQQEDSAGTHGTVVQTLLGTLTATSQLDHLEHAWKRIEDSFNTLFTTESSIDQLKQTVLQLAAMGKIVPQESSDEPAPALLKMITAEKTKLAKAGLLKKQSGPVPITDREEPYPLPHSWCWCRLGDTGIGSTGSTPKTGNVDSFGGKIEFIGPGQITPTGQLLESDKRLSENGMEESTEALPGDILMVCIGGSIGKSVIADRRVAFNQQINSIRPIHFSPQYLNMAISTDRFYKLVIEKSTGSATPIINRTKWEALTVPVPPLAEQHRIVAKVNEIMKFCDSLKAILQSAKATQINLADCLVEAAIH